MHPQLDVVDEIVRVVSWPTLIAGLGWVLKKWESGQREFREMAENTKLAVAKVSIVDAKVDEIQNNHLAHLQTGIEAIAESNDKAVTVLNSIDKGIAILTDRADRAARRT